METYLKMLIPKTLFSKPTRALRTLVASATLASLAFVSGVAQAQSGGVLNIYNWSDYIAEDTIKNFEKETGIKVRYDNFDTNEILHAKLVAGKTGYDIVVPSSNWAKIQIDGGLLKKLDRSKLPNFKNLDAGVMGNMASMDPGNQHLVPWLWGFTTVGINVDKVKAALGSTPMPDNAWDLIFKPEYASKLKGCGISVLDSASEVFPAILRYLGKPAYSKNPSDYQEAGKVLNSIRPFISLFSSSGYINDMAGGSVCLALGWNGDINIARQRAMDAKNGNKIEALMPKSGAVLFFDTMAIPADAVNVDAAHKFIDYIMRPEVAASLTNKVFYANPNASSIKFVNPDVAKNKTVFLSDEDRKNMSPPEPLNNDIRRLSTRLFTTFKTGV
jgi:putrescine transport system substrate-binding protein